MLSRGGITQPFTFDSLISFFLETCVQFHERNHRCILILPFCPQVNVRIIGHIPWKPLQLRTTRCASKSLSVLIGPLLGYGFLSMYDSKPSSTNLCFTRSIVLSFVYKTCSICSLVILSPNGPLSELIRIQVLRNSWEVCFPLRIKDKSWSLSSFVRVTLYRTIIFLARHK